MTNRVLRLLKPLMTLVPEVEEPHKTLHWREKLTWTAVSLLVFLIASQIPLYGMRSTKSSDPFYFQRMTMASNRGTLMELGISPIMTASLVMQLLQGAKILTVDQNDEEEKALFQGAQKLFGLIITAGEAVIFVSSGMYGNPQQLGVVNCILIVMQLFFAAVMVLMLDEILSKGWGLGGGTTVFIAANICETIVWKLFSPATVNYGNGTEFEGAIIALFHYLFSKENKVEALRLAFYRPYLPNLLNVASTILIFVVIVILQCFRVDYPVKPKNIKGGVQPYAVRLFYTSNMPVMLQNALVSNIFFFSQMIHGRFPNNPLVGLIGKWVEAEGSGRKVAVGGLCYILQPPSSVSEAISNPVHTLLYLVVILAMCGFFSRTWLDVSGSSARDVAANLRRQGLIIAGHDRKKDMIKELDLYIPIAASFGGMIVGALSLFADLMGAIGSGTGILLAVSSIYQAYESIEKEMRQG